MSHGKNDKIIQKLYAVGRITVCNKTGLVYALESNTPNKPLGAKTTKVQSEILEKMRQGSVIGEFSEKTNGSYKLFTRKSLFKSKSWNHSPFILRRLNKNTVFALLALGVIEKSDSIKAQMLPFSRDVWYVYRGN